MKLIRFFDVLEDKIRKYLSHSPITYALLGIIGIVLIWRGVWHLADDIGIPSLVSIFLGLIILLSTGLLVALAIGDEVIINAFRGRKKITEMRIEETLTIAEKVEEMKNILKRIENSLTAIKKEEKEIEKEISG